MTTAVRQPRGYTLAEMIAVLVISAMVLTAILAVYTRANRAAEAVLEKIETPVLATEVLELIARDLNGVMGGEYTSLEVKNGFDNGFVTAQMTLRCTVENDQLEEQLLKEIVWRAAYDYDSAIPGLVIYRSHKGMGLEDKLLDQKRAALESEYPMIPICRGVTFFKIEIPQGEGLLDRWSDASLPGGVKVSLSFAEPYETVRGTQDVLEHERVSRTIAVDRTRTIRFTLPKVAGEDANQPQQDGRDEEVDGTSNRQTRRR